MAKAAPKKAATKAAPSGKTKNKWLANDGGFDASKFYGPDRVLFLPGGLLSADEVPEYLDGSLPGE